MTVTQCHVDGPPSGASTGSTAAQAAVRHDIQAKRRPSNPMMVRKHVVARLFNWALAFGTPPSAGAAPSTGAGGLSDRIAPTQKTTAGRHLRALIEPMHEDDPGDTRDRAPEPCEPSLRQAPQSRITHVARSAQSAERPGTFPTVFESWAPLCR